MIVRQSTWLLLVLAAHPVWAQQQDAPRLDISQLGLQRPQFATVHVLPLCPRELTTGIARARKAMEAGDFAEALERIEAVRREADDKDYFIGEPGEAGTHSGLQAELERLVRALSEKDADLLETRWGSIASSELRQAIEDHDLDGLQAVARDYLGVDAGRQAALLLARVAFDNGRPATAATWLQAVRRYAASRKYEPELSLLHAASLFVSGAGREQVDRVLADLPKRSPGLDVRLGGVAEPLFRGEQSPAEWLARYVPGKFQAATSRDWLTVRGREDHNGGPKSLAQRPEKPQWRAPMVEDPERAELLAELDAYYREKGETIWPSAAPLVVNDTVVARTLDRIYGIDPKTGKRLWWYPHNPFQPALDAELDDVSWSRRAHQMAWQDGAFGRLTSDGSNVYCLSITDHSSLATALRQNPFARRRVPNSSGIKQSNQLIGLSAEREGKLLFIAGGEHDPNPELEGVFFLGPPLAIRGSLYCLAEKGGDVRLMVLDSQTGQLQWTLTLANVSSSHLSVDQQRRMTGLTPSFHGGVLLCPTKAGVVTAVDVSRRSLLWAFQYPLPQSASVSAQQRAIIMMQINGRVTSAPTAETEDWKDPTLIVAGDRVLATPHRSGQLYCLELATGKLVWKRPRQDMSYVGCVHHGVVFVVGRYRVAGIRLEDGAAAWTESQFVAFPSGGAPSGLGLRAGDQYIVPVSDGELTGFDIRSGRVAMRIRTDAPPGNLAPSASGLISQSPMELLLLGGDSY